MPTDNHKKPKIFDRYTNHVKSVNELKNQIQQEEIEYKLTEQLFLKNLTKDFFDFTQYPYLPIDANSFLSDVIIKQDFNNRFIFSGIRYEFRGNNLTSTGKSSYISYEDWMALPDSIKAVDFEQRMNQNFSFVDTPSNFVLPFRSGITIVENDTYLLSWVKPHISSPNELILYSKNRDSRLYDDNNEKMLEDLKKLAINELKRSERHIYEHTKSHHVLHSSGRLNKKLINSVSSHIINLFGQEKLDEIYNKLENKNNINKIKIKETEVIDTPMIPTNLSTLKI